MHQPASIVRVDGPAVDPSMQLPLALMIFGFTGYYFVVLILRVRLELNERRIRALHLSGMFDDNGENSTAETKPYDPSHNAEASQ